MGEDPACAVRKDPEPPGGMMLMASSQGSWPLWLLFTYISFILGNTTR